MYTDKKTKTMMERCHVKHMKAKGVQREEAQHRSWLAISRPCSFAVAPMPITARVLPQFWLKVPFIKTTPINIVGSSESTRWTHADVFDAHCTLYGSVHNLPNNDSIWLRVGRFNASSLYGDHLWWRFSFVLKLAGPVTSSRAWLCCFLVVFPSSRSCWQLY